MTRAGEKLYALPPEPMGGRRVIERLVVASLIVATVAGVASMIMAFV